MKAPQDKNSVKFIRGKDESEPRALARAALTPVVKASMTLQAANKPAMGDVSLNELVNELAAQTEAAKRGDLSRAEDMLVTQAHTLDALFHELASMSLP